MAKFSARLKTEFNQKDFQPFTGLEILAGVLNQRCPCLNKTFKINPNSVIQKANAIKHVSKAAEDSPFYLQKRRSPAGAVATSHGR